MFIWDLCLINDSYSYYNLETIMGVFKIFSPPIVSFVRGAVLDVPSCQ